MSAEIILVDGKACISVRRISKDTKLGEIMGTDLINKKIKSMLPNYKKTKKDE